MKSNGAQPQPNEPAMPAVLFPRRLARAIVTAWWAEYQGEILLRKKVNGPLLALEKFIAEGTKIAMRAGMDTAIGETIDDQ